MGITQFHKPIAGPIMKSPFEDDMKRLHQKEMQEDAQKFKKQLIDEERAIQQAKVRGQFQGKLGTIPVLKNDQKAYQSFVDRSNARINKYLDDFKGRESSPEAYYAWEVLVNDIETSPELNAYKSSYKNVNDDISRLLKDHGDGKLDENVLAYTIHKAKNHQTTFNDDLEIWGTYGGGATVGKSINFVEKGMDLMDEYAEKYITTKDNMTPAEFSRRLKSGDKEAVQLYHQKSKEFGDLKRFAMAAMQHDPEYQKLLKDYGAMGEYYAGLQDDTLDDAGRKLKGKEQQEMFKNNVASALSLAALGKSESDIVDAITLKDSDGDGSGLEKPNSVIEVPGAVYSYNQFEQFNIDPTDVDTRPELEASIRKAKSDIDNVIGEVQKTADPITRNRLEADLMAKKASLNYLNTIQNSAGTEFEKAKVGDSMYIKGGKPYQYDGTKPFRDAKAKWDDPTTAGTGINRISTYSLDAYKKDIPRLYQIYKNEDPKTSVYLEKSGTTIESDMSFKEWLGQGTTNQHIGSYGLGENFTPGYHKEQIGKISDLYFDYKDKERELYTEVLEHEVESASAIQLANNELVPSKNNENNYTALKNSLKRMVDPQVIATQGGEDISERALEALEEAKKEGIPIKVSDVAMFKNSFAGKGRMASVTYEVDGKSHKVRLPLNQELAEFGTNLVVSELKDDVRKYIPHKTFSEYESILLGNIESQVSLQLDGYGVDEVELNYTGVDGKPVSERVTVTPIMKDGIRRYRLEGDIAGKYREKEYESLQVLKEILIASPWLRTTK